MDTTLIATYCLIDDMLQAAGHREAPQRRVSDAEVMTTALCAARFFRGNFNTARLFLYEQGYIPRMLSKSQFNRRLHRTATLFERLFQGLASFFKQQETDAEGQGRNLFLIDSFPVAVCDNIRIDQCRIYPKEATEDAFRGFIASKRRYFYGLKVFLMTTHSGHPVEVFFTPGSCSDTAQLKHFAFDLARGSTVYGDKAFNEYFTEDVLAEAAEITLLPLRKQNSRRGVAAYVEYVQHYYRKGVETAASLIERLLPKSIHAVTARGFELKVFLFVLALSIDGLL
jgi:hypothetical protein